MSRVKEGTTPVKRPLTPTGITPTSGQVKRMYFTPSRTPTPQRAMEDDEDENVYPRTHNMAPQEILESLTTDPNIYTGNITCIPRLIPAREAALGVLSDEALDLLDEDLMDAYFDHLGLTSEDGDLFTHQAEAIEAIIVEKRKNICIATSTSSGKSLAFNLPILSELIRADGEATALYVYPTKALTQDQKRVIDCVVSKRVELRDTMGESQKVFAEILDGDVKDFLKRKEIMDNSNLILTNPDMIHHCILDKHKQFCNFLKKVRFVVIDEAHAYHGAFGGHVACVLRRLRRVIDYYQKQESNSPGVQFVLCSATIGNPSEHVSNLVGLDCDKLVSADGSPSGERILTIWNSRASESMTDLVNIVCKFICSGVRFICFCKNRFGVERLLTMARTKLGKINDHLSARIVSYRAGYNAEDRRTLEREIFSGKVLGVIATTALELGMDIGSLDVAISFGFPGSIHSLWQQWGRAGRGSRSSLCMLICKEEDVVDSFIGQDADERLLELDVEDAVVQTGNPSIVKAHLICADQELAMKTSTEWNECRAKYWPGVNESVFLSASKEAPFVTTRRFFSIRNIDSRKISVHCEGREIDSFDLTKAVLYVYPGAVHFVQGQEYRIVDLKISLRTDSAEQNKAIAVKASHDYFTSPCDVTTISPQIPATESFGVFHRSRVDVSLNVRGFNKLAKKRPHERIPGGFEGLELPTIAFSSQAVWIDTTDWLASNQLPSTRAHGAAHAIFFAACRKLLLSSQSDIRCSCGDIERNRILIYDAQKDGVGAAEAIFKRMKEIIQLAIKTVRDCPCIEGCMKCLLFSNCGMNNEFISKQSTLDVLRGLIYQDVT